MLIMGHGTDGDDDDDSISVMFRMTIWIKEFPDLCRNKIKQQGWWSKDLWDFDPWSSKAQTQAANFPYLL